MGAAATARPREPRGAAPHRKDITPPEQGGAAKSCSARAAFLRLKFSKHLVRTFGLFAVLYVAFAPLERSFAAPPGTPIVNRGEVSFSRASGPVTNYSNEVSLIVAPAPSPATIVLWRADPNSVTPLVPGATQCVSGQSTVLLPPPLASDGQPLALGQPLPLSGAQVVHGGEAVFIDLIDLDRNRDSAVIDRIELTLTSGVGDTESVILEETAADSGRFVGYIQTSAAAVVPSDCALQVERNGGIEASYVDPDNAADAVQATALVDPFGLVFDSRTGAPVNGARVELVDLATGSPAIVLGDDGVSSYPAVMITGQNVTDSGGTVYSFPPGIFRFPLIAAGSYRLVIDPPENYTFPSDVADTSLQALAAAPFSLSPASRGDVFVVSGQLATAIDVPLDPTSDTLFIEKITSSSEAAIGDFVPYQLRISNASEFAMLENVVVTDALPVGMRYQSGSARLDATQSIEPVIAPDGRTMTFALGDFDPGEQMSLSYVSVVAAGATGTELVNRAMASADGGIDSNMASAIVALREDLFRSSAILMGRVVAGSCDTTIDTGEAVPGVRVYLEDGRYAITDSEGKYHFEGLKPGSHVAQLDTVTLPVEFEAMQGCDLLVRNAGSAISQFVELRGGALATADFLVARRPLPSGDAQLSFSTEVTASGFSHSATAEVRSVALSEAEVLVLLPDEFAYVPMSARIDGNPIAEPEAQYGSLRFRLGPIAANTAPEISFETMATSETSGQDTVQAVLRFDTPAEQGQSTAPAANVVQREAARVVSTNYTFAPGASGFAPQFGSLMTQVDVRNAAELDRIAAEWVGLHDLEIYVVGHADRTPIAERNRDRFPDNYALSRARGQAVADYLAEALPGALITVDGLGADEPIALGDDAASLARNRRVEIQVTGVATVEASDASVRVLSAEAITPLVSTTGSFDADPLASYLNRPSRQSVLPPIEPPIEISTVEPGLAWVQPGADFTPGIPSLRIAIAHGPDQSVQLAVNGRVVNALNFEGIERDPVRPVALSRWRGVDLHDGDNQLVATVLNAAGEELTRLEREIRYGSGAVRAELLEEQSVLMADGRTQPVITLRVFDAAGEPARPGTLGTFSVDPPYRSWWEVESLRDNPLLVSSRREPTFSVDEGGLVHIVLEPTAQTGNVVLRMRFNERREQEVRAWLAPEQREWILVGIAEGTVAYTKISDAVVPIAVDDGYTSDGRLAFFAKGRIKGDMLLTAAFDSDRDDRLAEQRLFGTIEPDRYYTLYGDAVEQRFEAASTEKLYLKIERRQYAAMFGDFETGFTITELGRYSRALTGFKTEFAGERYTVSAFAAENRETYGRDELRGDGTSGPYRLSRSALVANSDRLRIEVRDRIRSELVVDTRVLARFSDYSIDYLTGIVRFREPIPSRDSAFNPVYVIAEYETLDSVASGTTAGARAITRLAEEKVELGATVVNEGAASGDTRVVATDLLYRPTGALELRAEAAQSSASDPSVGGASAYLAELQRVTETSSIEAYVREQETGFGVGQQLATEAGTRKIGIDVRTELTERWSGRSEVFRSSNLETGADRMHAAIEARRESDDATAVLGLRSVKDEVPLAGSQRSDLLTAGGSIDLLDDKITLRALTEQAVNRRDESLDFPGRSLVGLDYRLTNLSTLFAEVEDSSGQQIDSRLIRVGMRSTPRSGMQLSSSMNREFDEYGPRVFANLGLTQSWRIGDSWAMDVGVDQSKTLAAGTARAFDADVPLVVGDLNEDFLATFVGGQYRTDLWTGTARIERRSSDSAERTALLGAIFREPVEGRAMSLSVNWLDNKASVGRGRVADSRFSYVYRPGDGRFIILERFDLQLEERDDALQSIRSSRFVNNYNMHWQVGRRFEIGGQVGARYVESTIDGIRYSGWSSLLGFDMRRDINHKFDFGAHATRLASQAGRNTERSFGFDLGINAAHNLWLSVGYNLVGFSDDQFDASRFTAAGPYIRFRFKADQDSFTDLDLSRLRPGAR